MDDVAFGRNGRDAERWRLTRAAMNDGAESDVYECLFYVVIIYVSELFYWCAVVPL